MLRVLILVSLSAGAFCAVTSQDDCDDIGERFSSVTPFIASFFYLQEGKIIVNSLDGTSIPLYIHFDFSLVYS